jgi:hypothetical protein
MKSTGQDAQSIVGSRLVLTPFSFPKFDFVCERTHGCAPVPLDDQKIAELQGKDPRCK